jgi:hypothetical protein
VCGDGLIDVGEECDDANAVHMVRIGPYGSNLIV